MGNLLSAIGRARPATQIQEYRTAITNRENESLRTEAYVQSQKMAAQRQQKELEIITNRQKQEQEIQKKLDHPVSWDVMSHRFEGGAESPMFKMTYELAKNNGLIATGAGLGTISIGNKQKLDELMKSPEFQTNMSKTRIDYWTNQVNSLAKVASGDPEAKKASNLSGKHLEEAQQRAQLFLDKALYQDKAYVDMKKQMLDQQKADETERKNKAMEGKTTAETETIEEKNKGKKLESLKSDFMQQIGRGYSAERGVGQFVEDPNKQLVAKKAYDSALIIAQTYVNSGGKWEDLGLEDPSKKTDELPEGLTEIDIDHNMKKYNKTREEVIAKFLEGKK